MASADQLKELLVSYQEGDDQRFYAVAMQVAAHEAKLGHGKLAEELRALIGQAKSGRGLNRQQYGKRISHQATQNELKDLLVVSRPTSRFGEMVLEENLAQ